LGKLIFSASPRKSTFIFNSNTLPQATDFRAPDEVDHCCRTENIF